MNEAAVVSASSATHALFHLVRIGSHLARTFGGHIPLRRPRKHGSGVSADFSHMRMCNCPHD